MQKKKAFPVYETHNQNHLNHPWLIISFSCKSKTQVKPQAKLEILPHLCHVATTPFSSQLCQDQVSCLTNMSFQGHLYGGRPFGSMDMISCGVVG